MVNIKTGFTAEDAEAAFRHSGEGRNPVRPILSSFHLAYTMCHGCLGATAG